MTTNHERRSRLMGYKIKEQSWDLEDLKKRNRVAKEALTQADEALNEVETIIDATENAIRHVYTERPDLDLEAIETARKYLSDKQALCKERSRAQQKAAQKASQAESQLKQTVLYVKALEQIKAETDRMISRIQEDRTSEQLADLWRQRYGRSRS